MFRTSHVHHQEDYIVHAVLYGMFFMHLCKQYWAHPPTCQSLLWHHLSDKDIWRTFSSKGNKGH